MSFSQGPEDDGRKVIFPEIYRIGVPGRMNEERTLTFIIAPTPSFWGTMNKLQDRFLEK